MSARRIVWAASLLVLALAFAVVVVACGSGTSSERASPASRESASGLKRVVVGGLSVRVPAGWRSYDYEPGGGWKGVSLADSSHEPSDAVIFGFYSREEPGMTAAEMGKAFADAVAADATTVRERRVILRCGLAAYGVRYTLGQHGRTFRGLVYALVVSSSSGTRGYLVMYRAIDAMAGHMAQFRASVRSIRELSPSRAASEAGDTMPAWSPDGRKIVFAGDRGGHGARLYLINADGSDLHPLTTDPSCRYDDTMPAWSPDGRQIVFASDRGRDLFHLYVINADGSHLRQLTTTGVGDSGDGSPAWSPDGRRLAFDSDRGGKSQIYAMNPDGSDQRPLTPHQPGGPLANLGDWEPAWSPDGRTIAFDSERGAELADPFSIFVIDDDGSHLQRLTATRSGTRGDSRVTWSADGHELAFASDRTGRSQIYVMNADGSGQRQLTTTRAGEIGDGDPAWSPDGRTIAFDSDRSGQNHIYLMNADGSNQRPLTK